MEKEQPFTGVRVAEFGQFVAVPFCAQLLAEGGAEVIKIEAPEGDPTRRMGQLAPGETRIYISRNRGKHALPLRLRDPAARPVVDALLRWADVVLMNFRPGLGAQLGLDTDSLAQRFPRLIIGEITPFGKAGPDASLAAMDEVVQARSGLMAAIGLTVDGRPATGGPVISDYMSAMTLAFGIASALLRREKTGSGGVVDVTLMQSAMTLANNQLIRAEDRDRPVHDRMIDRLNQQRSQGEAYAQQAAGLVPTRALPIRSIYLRTYDTADGTIAVACASRNLQVRFCEAVGFEDDGVSAADMARAGTDDYYHGLRQQVEATIRGKSSSEWVSILNKAGIPVSTVKFPVELFEDSQALANGMFQVIDHPTAGPIRSLSPPVQLDGSGFQPAQATPTFGSETRALLAKLGLTDDEIQALIDREITHEGL
jgi:crotonobetainyl-CoA:carnitine CoA-transferase CaiB-like acyl-CoA transferase